MSEPTRDHQDDGALLQGSDGAVYFIPNERLAEFRIADEDASGVREALDSLDSEVSGFSQTGPVLKDGVFPLKAFSGPIGIKRTRTHTPDNGGDGIWGG